MSRQQKILSITGKMVGAVLVPCVPIGGWWYSTIQDRNTKSEQVRTKVRVPNIQTVDDLMIEKCQPGDVVLFDRRCHKCAAGPMAAFACILGKTFLCDSNDGDIKRVSNKVVDIGSFDHTGIVVPGYSKNEAEALDPSNLLLLEATAGEGVVARPLLSRLEHTQSRTVLLLPLASPGQRRNDDDHEESAKTKRMQDYMQKSLIKFRDNWVQESKKQQYSSAHASLGIIGALGYAMGLYKTSPAPVSPSGWLVVSALMESGAGMHLSERKPLESKVEDFLRDHRFCSGEDVVRLRPGWKFQPPVVMRETSRS